jgi:hypothetical protein
MIPRERRFKGLSLFIIFYLPIIDFMEKRGYMSFLGVLFLSLCFKAIKHTIKASVNDLKE